MKTIKIKISDIKPNPFKKNINKGELSKETISKLIESIDHGTLPELFTVRKSEKNYELCFGHHRQHAIKKKKGKDYIVLCDIVERTDEQMIVDMARENLAQRSDDFKEERGTILFVKDYLSRTVMGHDSSKKTHKNEIGARQIALFLSKDGKVVSHNKVARILKIENSISPEIIKDVERSSNQWDKDDNKISVSVAEEISQIKEHKDQKMFVEEVKEKQIGHKKLREVVSAFQKSDEETKAKVRTKEIDFEDIKIENLKKEIKKRAEEELQENKGQIRVTHYKKFLRDAGNQVGDTNDRILKTCAYLEGLEKSGVLYDLDWNTTYRILEVMTKGGKRYSSFGEKIMEKI